MAHCDASSDPGGCDGVAVIRPLNSPVLIISLEAGIGSPEAWETGMSRKQMPSFTNGILWLTPRPFDSSNGLEGPNRLDIKGSLSFGSIRTEFYKT